MQTPEEMRALASFAAEQLGKSIIQISANMFTLGEIRKQMNKQFLKSGKTYNHISLVQDNRAPDHYGVVTYGDQSRSYMKFEFEDK